MKFLEHNPLSLLLLCVLIFLGIEANALSYDYTASIECLENPHKPQYGGGIIINPELNQGLKGWSTNFGKAKMEHRESDGGGNKFIVARGRNQTHDSILQKIYMQKDKLYTFSAWLQVSEGKVDVSAVFKTASGNSIYAGAIIAQSKCWSMLKGGLTVDDSGTVQLYFESNNTAVEIWVDSISLQPFSQDEWKSHQDQSIEKTRKRRVRIQVVDTQGNPLGNATISIKQNNIRLPFGCASNKNILTNIKYQQWFTSRFPITTFEDEMKWYTTEPSQGKEDYSVPDAMFAFMNQHNIAVRGHNIIWDDPKYQPSWVSSLSPTSLASAAGRRLYSVVTRYKDQVIGWDVVNENLHWSFFESKIGEEASSMFYSDAHKYDTRNLMFMNDYNTLEESGDQLSSPARYLQKLREIQSYPGNAQRMAIGLESHFTVPNLPYMRASLDTLAQAALPIWLTEVDVKSGPNQALYLEQVLREGYGHPKVNGMIIWGGWHPEGCWRMCLTDNNFNNLPTGDVVDKLLHEWSGGALVGTTDTNGVFEASFFHGDYEMKIIQSDALKSMSTHNFKVASTYDSSSSVETFTMIVEV